MFDYEEFLAKAAVYFERGADAEESSEERALWLLLGLEFFLRAPLAQVHPTLLALPEGDSILYAAGVERARGIPRSIPTKAVIDRLTKIDPVFGEDRGKDAAFLLELRNEELHSSRGALANAGEQVWMPRFLNVVEAICSHLELAAADVLSEEILQAAETYRATADAATQGEVTKLMKAAKSFFDRLTPAEVESRASVRPASGGAKTDCPSCGSRAAWMSLSEARTSEPGYNEDDQEIVFKAVHVVTGLVCSVCGLTLTTTAQVVAAGIKRLHIVEYSESRYEGWEELMTYEAAMELLADDYGND